MDIQKKQTELTELVAEKNRIEKEIKAIKKEAKDKGFVVLKNIIQDDSYIYCIERSYAMVTAYHGEKGALYSGLVDINEITLEDAKHLEEIYKIIIEDPDKDYKNVPIYTQEFGDHVDDLSCYFSGIYGDYLNFEDLGEVTQEFDYTKDVVFEIHQQYHCDGHDGDFERDSYIRICKRKKSFIKNFKGKDIDDRYNVYLSYLPYKK